MRSRVRDDVIDVGNNFRSRGSNGDVNPTGCLRRSEFRYDRVRVDLSEYRPIGVDRVSFIR